MQTIGVNVTPSGIFAKSTSPYFGAGAEVFAPPSFPDPLPGGYTYQFCDTDCPNETAAHFFALFQPNFATAAPFYYSLDDILSGCAFLAAGSGNCNTFISLGNTLNFFDAPQYVGSLPTGQYTYFTTSLVGFSSSGAVSGTHDTWQWKSNYTVPLVAPNGSSGGASTTSGGLPPTPGGTGGVTLLAVNGVPLVPSTNISSTASGLAYSRVSQTFNGTVTINNISGSAIGGPVQVIFMSLPTGVTVANSSGSFYGNPVITVPSITALGPGQSATVAVQFKNPSNAVINFTPVVYSGSIN